MAGINEPNLNANWTIQANNLFEFHFPDYQKS